MYAPKELRRFSAGSRGDLWQYKTATVNVRNQASPISVSSTPG